MLAKYMNILTAVTNSNSIEAFACSVSFARQYILESFCNVFYPHADIINLSCLESNVDPQETTDQGRNNSPLCL